MSDNMYLHHRHNRVAKVIYEELVSQNNNEKGKLKHIDTPPTVTHIDGKEIWWNAPVKLPNTVEHNRLDLIVWNTDSKLCTIVEVCIPLDTNVTLRSTWKEKLYMPIISEMSRVYKNYTFEIIPIVIGALGTVPSSLSVSIHRLKIRETRFKPLLRRIQRAALIGSLKICKTFFNFKGTLFPVCA